MEKTIIRLEEVGSTNDYMKGYKSANEKDDSMVVVIADYQTRGKGQGSNSWESEAGKNLLMSIRVHPRYVPVRYQFFLSMAGALAVKDAVSGYVDGVTLKWPNDVYVGDRKLSGTLIETSVGQRQLKDCVFGVGVNVNQAVFRGDAPNPVSLFQLLGREVDREELASKLVDAFERYCQMLRNGAYGDVSALYHLSLYRRKGFHYYKDADGEFEAELVEVEDDGHLILHDREGRIRSYAFKEVAYII